MLKKHSCQFFLQRMGLCCLVLFSAPLAAQTPLSTFAVTEDTLAAIPHCLHYKVIGICYWLDCEGPDCHVATTPKVSHYSPDAVVTVFRQVKSDPWDYAKDVIDPVAYQAGEQQMQRLLKVKLGDGYESVSSSVDQDAHFKEVDVIGNPAITAFKHYDPLLLASVAKPLMPYYVSLADALLWRSPQREISLYPHYLLPGVHSVGTLVDNWGPIYPRTGFLDQPADAKAAAVIALRAAHIATRSAQPHLYQQLPSGDCGTECHVAKVDENDKQTQWQMIYPHTDTTCMVFGDNDLSQSQPWGSEAAVQGDGNYAWVLWRFYHGCISHAGKFLGSTNF